MSYDLMVFKKESAPKTRAEFMIWYETQTEWTEEHSYDDPANTSVELRNWFMEMIKTFPALNGPFAVSDDDVDDPHVTDYSIGRDVIYAAFKWSAAEQAYPAMYELAEKNGVGFFNASSDSLDIYFPVANGKLKPIDNGENSSSGQQQQTKTNTEEKKPWWKIW